jgi:hypothetical protein
MKTELKKLNISSIKFFVVIFMVLLTTSWVAFAARPKLSVTADKKEISKGETLKVEARMSWKQSENKDDMLIVKITPPSSNIMELVDSKQTASSQLTGDDIYAMRIMEYYFKAREKGQATIEPVVVEYFTGEEQEEKDIVKSEAINIKVVSYLSGLMKKFVTGIIFVVVTFLITGLVLFLKNHIKNSNKNKITETSDAIMEKDFLEAIKGFSKYIIEGDYKKYYTNTREVFGNYISKKYSISLPAKSGSDDMEKLPDQVCSLYSEWINIEEKVRFSGYQPEKNEQEKLTRETERYFKSLITHN